MQWYRSCSDFVTALEFLVELLEPVHELVRRALVQAIRGGTKTPALLMVVPGGLRCELVELIVQIGWETRAFPSKPEAGLQVGCREEWSPASTMAGTI